MIGVESIGTAAGSDRVGVLGPDRGLIISSVWLPGPRCEGWPGWWFRPVLAALPDRGRVLEPGEKAWTAGHVTPGGRGPGALACGLCQ